MSTPSPILLLAGWSTSCCEDRTAKQLVNSIAEEAKALRAALIEQEEKLATEMLKQEHEKLREEKLRQKIRETSVELRELEAKLRAAYFTKELYAQIAEKKVAKLEEKHREHAEAEHQQSIWKEDKELERQENLENFQRKLKYRSELLDQIAEVEKNRQKALLEFLREKKMLDEIVQRIHEEDIREMEERMMKMKKTQQEIELFRLARIAWKEKEKAELEEENRKILEYVEKCDAAERERVKAMKEREEKKSMVLDKLAAQIYQEQVRREEQLAALQEVQELEAQEEEERREREALERQLRQRVAWRQAQREHMAERLRQLRLEAEQEHQERQQMLVKFAEAERLEQATAERRRRAVLQHRSAVEAELRERRMRREEEMKRLVELHQLQAEEEQSRLCFIEEERLRLLKEHAAHLLGFLPRGLLRQDDLPHLGSEFVQGT
ncbi:meiosis-specific nuclear structural protein 1-like isoform X2 [Bacillus rossius redtenbacheri]|uniref:meiosis-specific nuclear structural protein 1-like isoform X2 n=1 Tax=Bacillus rossius redtenbacheri TaxID=93214 RepID=UPI002FDE5F95